MSKKKSTYKKTKNFIERMIVIVALVAALLDTVIDLMKKVMESLSI